MSQLINVGSVPNDHTGDTLRAAMIIVNDNFASIDTLLSGNDVLTISQITGLQTALNNINNQLSYIPGLQTDINSINNTIYTINQTLNSQNSSIADLYDEITNLQNQIYTKIEEAPIDGEMYVRKDAGWVLAPTQSGGGVYATPSFQQVLQVDNISGIGFQLNDATNVANLTPTILDFSTTATYTFIQDGFATMNFTSNKRIDVTADGIRFKNGPGNGYGNIIANSLQTSSFTPNYQLPSKASNGVFTLATTDMIGSTPSLQQVTNVGSETTNSIQINTGISATGSKVTFMTSDYIRLNSQAQGAMQIEWNRILFPSSNNIASSVVLGATGNAATNFWLPGFKSNYSTPQILTTQEDVWVPFTGSSNNINIVKNQIGNTFSTATFYTRGLTSSNGSITISSTGSNNNTNWGWDIRTNPNLLVDYLQFNTTSTATGAVGRFVWNDTDGTVDLGLKGGNVTLQVGQEQLVRVVNKTATNITLLESNYQAVRVTGAQGQRLKVDLALATDDALSSETIGLVTETIVNNQEGFVTISGLVNKINTTGSLQSETWADGDTLYLSPTVAGQITNIKPSAPSHMVIIGYVVHSHSVNGKIFVKVNNGYELDELHNVNIVGATGGQVLRYNGSNNLWENSNNILTTLNGLTASSQTFTIGTTGTDFNIVSTGSTHSFNIPTSSASNRGLLSSTDWTTFNNKGTVTSVAALTIGTTGTNVSSTVATGTTTPVITLNIPDASGSARGLVTTGVQTFGGSKTITGAFTVTPPSVTGALNTAAVSVNGTWNTTGNPTAFSLNVVNTASGASSLLMGLNTNGTLQFSVTKAGAVIALGTVTTPGITSGAVGNATSISLGGGAGTILYTSQTPIITAASHTFAGAGVFITSGHCRTIATNTNFSNSSGTGTFTSLFLNDTINQTGTANGISRGLWVNPVLTSATDYRGIEVTTGSIVLPYTTTSTTYSIRTIDYLVDFTTGTFTATLPTAVGCTGKEYRLKNSGTGVITIATTSSQTIDGSTTYSLSAQWKYVTVVSTGSNWIIMENN